MLLQKKQGVWSLGCKASKILACLYHKGLAGDETMKDWETKVVMDTLHLINTEKELEGQNCSTYSACDSQKAKGLMLQCWFAFSFRKTPI